jgi:SAM-dependent methyltransferase
VAERAREFDRRHGVDTAGIIHLGGLRITSANRDAGVRYQPTDPADFRDLIAKLPIDYREYIFVDFGSGKGRALLLASALPFKRIIGVEFSAELNEVARRNIARFPADRQRCRTIEIVTIDATEYEIPAEPAVLYFYNPFREPVLRRVLAGVRRSVGEHPRSVFVVLTGNAPLAPVIEEAGFAPLGVPGSGPTRGIFRAA